MNMAISFCEGPHLTSFSYASVLSIYDRELTQVSSQNAQHHSQVQQTPRNAISRGVPKERAVLSRPNSWPKSIVLAHSHEFKEVTSGAGVKDLHVMVLRKN
jgi:hypothetical protein